MCVKARHLWPDCAPGEGLLGKGVNEADAKDLAEDPEELVERTNKEIEDFS